MLKKEKPRMGRKMKVDFSLEETWEQVARMCEIQCTAEEISSILGISYDTLRRNCKEYLGVTFKVFYDENSSEGKRSLRRYQFDAAKKGNSQLLVWLGKQWLNQSDKIDQKIETKEDNSELTKVAEELAELKNDLKDKDYCGAI